MSTTTRSVGHAELLRRHPKNPLLTAKDWPYAVNTVFNPGAIRMPSGETILWSAARTAAASRT
jgi:predicted GH43/DUF377 family glycosyl hydrolase